MIQRIQSIFLLLAAISFGLLFVVPLALSNTATTQFLADKVYDISDHPVLLALTIIGILLSVLALFSFRNRKKQLRTGYLIIVVAILLPVAAYLLFLNESATAEPEEQAGMLLPAVAIVFTVVANFFIRKDEKLVKSMDRLR